MTEPLFRLKDGIESVEMVSAFRCPAFTRPPAFALRQAQD